MTEVLEWADQFRRDMWNDIKSQPDGFNDIRNCQNAPVYFSADCKVQAPDYWAPSSVEPQWTYDLYYKYLDQEQSIKNEDIIDQIKDDFELDLKEIADDFNLVEMKNEANEIDALFAGNRTVNYDFVKTFLVSFRWVFNAAFIAIPWTFISINGLIYNLCLNVVMNHWWAGGNFWLVGNTVFALLQFVHTWFLVIEWPFYLRHLFAYRWLMALVSIIYSTQIISDGIAVIGMDKWETDETYENYDLMDMFTDMFLAYNVVLHWPIALTTFIMIFKEVEMNIYQMMTANGPADYQLSW